MQDADAFGEGSGRREQFLQFASGYLRLGRRAAQHGVDQRGGGMFACLLGEFHRFAHRCMRRDAPEIAQLVEAQAQSDQNFEIEPSGRAVEVALEQEIQKPLPAQDSQGEFGRQRGIGPADARSQPREFSTSGRVGASVATRHRTSNAIWRAGEMGIGKL